MKHRGLVGLVLLCTCLCFFSCSDRFQQHFNGYIEGDISYLASPLGGALQSLLVERGVSVTRGQKLYTLDANPERLLLEQAQFESLQAQKIYEDLLKPRRKEEIDAYTAQIEAARAELGLATVRLQRFQKLYQKGAIEKDTVDAAIANASASGQRLMQLTAELALARLGARVDQIAAQKASMQALAVKVRTAAWNLEQKTILAPDRGVIIDTLYNPGEYVSPQAPVIALLSPDETFVEFFVPLETLNRLKLGDLVQFSSLASTVRTPAHISFIAREAEFVPPVVYSASNMNHLVFRVRARFAENPYFKLGQPVDVYI